MTYDSYEAAQVCHGRLSSFLEVMTMKSLLAEPAKYPRPLEIAPTLEAMQAVVVPSRLPF